MLRKLASLFFEEEEEVVEEEELDIAPVKLPPISSAIEKKPVNIELKETSKIEEPVQKPTEKPFVFEATKSATRIDLTPEPVVKTKRSVSESSVVYEFQPVISPIFGVSDKDKQTVVVKTTTPVDASPVHHSTLQTIISPIYGVKKSDGYTSEVPVTQAPSVTENDEHVIEVNNLSLDEILAEEPAVKEKIVEQFNLFDEDEN